jgi:hypothetical protein
MMADLWENRFTARTCGGHRLDRRKTFRCQTCRRKCASASANAMYCSKACYYKAAWKRAKPKLKARRQEAKELFGG